MKAKKLDKPVNITFHNPNTPEETAKLLIKISAENMADYIIAKLPHPEG